MPQQIFDNAQLTAMREAIDQIMEEMQEGFKAERSEIAHVVFAVASETSEFHTASLVQMARERLSQSVEKSPIDNQCNY